jgi:hypothetical protein
MCTRIIWYSLRNGYDDSKKATSVVPIIVCEHVSGIRVLEQ